jgi:hypothetical protein
MDKLEEFHYFTTPIYAIKKPEFLQAVKKVSDQYLAYSRSHHKNKKQMTLMTANYSNEKEVEGFAQYVSQTTWNILNSCGYKMDDLVTYFSEMWTQEHNFQSSMETHVHGSNVAMSAFYFLEMPKNGCKMIIHDPRPAKVITNLPVKDGKEVTPASLQVIFNPEPGTLIFAPPWLPHQFTRNQSRENPVRFVHMNLGVTQAPAQETDQSVEVL